METTWTLIAETFLGISTRERLLPRAHQQHEKAHGRFERATPASALWVTLLEIERCPTHPFAVPNGLDLLVAEPLLALECEEGNQTLIASPQTLISITQALSSSKGVGNERPKLEEARLAR